jgi:hypothetical protein
MVRIFGAESKEAATARLANGYDLFSWAMRRKNVPAFWGRSISGVNRLTFEEIEFLRGQNCKLALIFDELTEAGIARQNGSDDAMRAAEAARSLGVPENMGTALFAYIRGDWNVNHNWMISYAYTLIENGYIPGFIGNTDSSENFNFDRECSHYVQFMGDIGQNRTVYWATEPKSAGESDEWSPYCPSELSPEQIHLWSGSCIYYNDSALQANTVYARDESVMQFMWDGQSAYETVSDENVYTENMHFCECGCGGINETPAAEIYEM